MQKTLTDDFPFDLPQLIDGGAPDEKGNEKCVWIFYLYILRPLERETNMSSSFLYVMQVLIHQTPTHTPSVKRTPTYVACVLMDEMRGGPRLPKCRQWTDCGEVMNG